MQQELALSEASLPLLAIPQGHRTGLFLTQVIHFIRPLPLQQPQGGAPRGRCDVSTWCIHNKTLSFKNRNWLLFETSSTQRATPSNKEEGAATSTTQLCSEQILRGRARCRQQTSELAFSKNTIYSPLLVTAGQGKQVRRRPCTPGCSVVLCPTCLSQGSCRGLALYFAV